MASYRKSTVNRQQQRINFVNTIDNDTKFKRSGIVVPNRIFVGGICPTATEDDLLGLFSQYGTVKDIKIVLDQNGSSKGYGFVTFEKAEDVNRLNNDAKNLIINDRRLNIAPAVMKNPSLVNRYPDSYVVPVTPNLYFTNNIQYQYQENNNVYPNGTYIPQLTVSEGTYYPSSYGIPTTPYQGAALYYPVPHNTSPLMMGPQPFSSYQAIASNNSNYIYSSPNSVTTSPLNNTKNSTQLTAGTNTSEIQGSHGTPLFAAMPPNLSQLPPPLPYHLSHPPQYYNSNVMPSYSGEVYYNMVQSPCYPMIPINGQESYIPYYEINESCNSNNNNNNNNVPTEECCLEAHHGYQTNATGVSSCVSDKSGKDSTSVSSNNNSNNSNNQTSISQNSNNNNTESKQNILPPTTEFVPEQGCSTENNGCTAIVPQTPGIQTQHSSNAEFSTSTYVQRRSAAAIIYPNTPIPQPNIYFGSVYVAEATNSSMAAQCQYPKNLSEHCVSDHPPKRDSKYAAKKFNVPLNKDTPPNIPKFPYIMNNNFPGYINRNVKEKDFKNANNKNGESKMSQRGIPRNANGGPNPLPKPRVFHNQNQYGQPMRSQRNERMIVPNVQYSRSGAIPQSRQSSFEQSQPNLYEYQNNYHGHAAYIKNSNYDNHRKYSQHTNSGYKGKYDKVNASNSDASFSNKNVEDRNKKYPTQQEEAVLPNNERIQLEQNANINGNVQQQQQQQQQQQHVCVEMQNLTL